MSYLENFGIQVGQSRHHEEAIYGIVVAFNLLNSEMTAYLNNFNLTPAKLNVLMILKHHAHGQGISQVEISKKLIVTPSNMTKLLDKLEKEKLIERVSREGDRRVKLIQITDQGSKVLDAAWPGYKRQLGKLAEGLNLKDQETIARLLMKWIDHLGG